LPKKKATSSWVHDITGPERGPATKEELQDLSNKTQSMKRHSPKTTKSERDKAEKKAKRWKIKKQPAEKRRSKNIIDESREKDEIESLLESLARERRPTS